jgi:ribonuclease Z
LPFTFIGDENGNHFIHLYAPAEAERHLRKYISCLFEVNSLREEEELPCKDWYEYHGFSEPTRFRTILNKNAFEVDVVLCDHGVPTISYCFSLIKQKLREELSGLTGKEIAERRKGGEIVTKEVVQKTFAFICDTSISVLTAFPDILLYPLVIIECTFLYPEERENATQTKHIHWEELKPFVVLNPQTLFVLIHFSLRYTEDEILEFFRKEQEGEGGGVHNIKVWAGDTWEAK